MKNQNLVISLLIVVIIGMLIYWVTKPTQQTPPAEFHEHANFAVFVDDVQYNFNQSKYMTNESDEVGKRQYIHMHDMDGGLIHLHQPGLTLGMFFDSIGMQLNSTCLVLDNGASICNSADKTWKLYVDGNPTNEFDKLGLHDLQKVLLSYGNHDDPNIQNQLNLVPSDACYYSAKCPTPPGFVNNESLTCVTNKPGICSG
jgi:hypothetical protein